MLAVYADSLRRIAKAEADYYEANIERRLRAKGLDERQLIELGTQLGDQVIGLLERVLLTVYRRRREHVGPSAPSTMSRRHLRAPVSNNEWRSHRPSALST